MANANVSAFVRNGDQFDVEYGDDNKLTVDWILDATGRIPNVEDIGLEKVMLSDNAHGVIVMTICKPLRTSTLQGMLSIRLSPS